MDVAQEKMGTKNKSGSTDEPLIFNASDGVTLFMHHWQTGSKSKRQLFVVHGLGEHGGRYSHFSHFLREEFSDIYALDLRGHGRSGGTRGFAPEFDAFCGDIKSALNEIQKINKQSKKESAELFILGHSMGGLVTLRFLQTEKKHGFKAAILSSPFLGMAIQVPGWKIALGKVLNKTLSKLQLSSEINPSYVSHDPAIVEAYVKDRLVHTKCTPHLYFELLRTLEIVNSAAENGLGLPSHFMVAGDDHLVNAKSTLQFFQNLKEREKSLKEYPGMYHEIFNEVEKKQVFEDLKAWLKDKEL